MSDTLLTSREVAEVLGTSRSTVAYIKRLGYLPFVKVGRKVLYRADDVKEYQDREKQRMIEAVGRISF